MITVTHESHNSSLNITTAADRDVLGQRGSERTDMTHDASFSPSTLSNTRTTRPVHARVARARNLDKSAPKSVTCKGRYNDYRTHTNPTTLGLILQPTDRTVRQVDTP